MDIFKTAQQFYDRCVEASSPTGHDHAECAAAWREFSNDQLRELWAACSITVDNPYGQEYDDEVYDEMDRRGLFAE